MSKELPNLLTLPGGGIAATPEQWNTICRPNLAALVLREEYGVMPPEPRELRGTVVRTDPNALAGRATLREIDIVTVAPDSKIELLVITPNAAVSPSGCFLGLNFRGNHSVLDDPMVRPPRSKRQSGVDIDSERGSACSSWPLETIIDRGYALATLYNGDAVSDNRDLAVAQLANFAPSGMSAADGDAPATIACWAWSLSRAIDYLVSDSANIGPNKIALVGHSRNGKTALLAGAMDTRAALVIPSQSGCGGAGPSRDIGEEWTKRETVSQINTAFPHWFCQNFKRYNEAVDRLPFDQHALIALCAPRPVLVSSAAEDLWANPAGSFAMLRAADPVYRLVYGEGIEASAMPALGEPLTSRLGHFIRPGGHAMTHEDWSAWLDYADIWLGADSNLAPS